MGLGSTGIDGYRKALNDLARIGSQHVSAQHAVCICIHEQFQERLLIAPAERVSQSSEAASIDGQIGELLAGIVFVQTNRGNVRMAEDGSRDVVVTHDFALPCPVPFS